MLKLFVLNFVFIRFVKGQKVTYYRLVTYLYTFKEILLKYKNYDNVNFI